MRVLIIASYAPSLINFRGRLIKRLISEGHTVFVGAPDISAEMRMKLEKLSAIVCETPMSRKGLNPYGDLSYLLCLFCLIKQHSFDRVLTYTVKPNIWGAFAARLAGVKSIAMVTGLGYAFTETGEKVSVKNRVLIRMARSLYKAAASCNWRIIFQNGDDLQDFVQAGCLGDKEKTRLVNGSGVDLSYYRKVELPNDPVFLMISRVLGNKGVREFAAAGIDVLESFPDARFQLIGLAEDGPDGIDASDIQSWKDRGIEVLGATEDVRPAIAGCSIYVLPSYREGTPRSVLEAMAMGRPVLTTDAPGCRETVTDGLNGWMVPVRDAAALARKMVWMIENPMAREEMGAKSFALAHEKFEVNKVNTIMIQHMELSQ